MKKLILMLLLSPVLLMAETNLHASTAMPATCSALSQLDSASLVTSEEALRRYIGVYQLNEQFHITVSMEDGKLYGLPQGDAEKTEFTPLSKNKFIIKGPETEVEFLEGDGKVQYMFVNMQGGLKLKKVR